MKTSKGKFSITALLLTFFGVLFIGIAIVAGGLFFNAKTLMVPTVEFPEIQDAVDAAVKGDIILVKAKEDGTPYLENVKIMTDNIKLIGIGKEKPVLDGDFVVNTGLGIDLTDRSGVLVKHFIVRNFEGGIFLDGLGSNMIKGNNVNENSGGIVLRDSASNMIKGNTVKDNEVAGIDLSESNSNMIKGNTVKDNGEDGFGSGIELDASNNNTIKRNNVIGNEEDGIFFSNSASNMIKGNTVKDNGEDGIDIEDSSRNVIKSNTIIGNVFDGIEIENSNRSIIKNNSVNENGTDAGGSGIALTASTNNMIKGNTANDNANDGILLDVNSKFNDVFFNRAFGNGDGMATFDIEGLGTDNNFKGNKCGMSSPPEICN
ncbi:right-handed parallel beta-helix repeat-containing protein [Jeotgalibacillus marinus]|uniref:Right-handed parallel beta-helix repeat-containing protein n=1 Tax=Jeotgalibacillus marinus TaxID=86667 RepID=A0ABV3Q1H0_9BACL